MTRILLILILSAVAVSMHAQENDPFRHTVIVSAGGEGGVYTIGYERLLVKDKPFGAFLHAGISGFPIDQRITFAFPVSFGGYYRLKNCEFLAGPGIGSNVSYYYQEFSGNSAFSRLRYYSRAYLEAGARLRISNDRYSIGVKYVPFISFIENFQWENWAGINFGIHF